MHPSILNLLPRLCQQHLQLIGASIHDLRVSSQEYILYQIAEMHELKRADLFQPLVSRPRACRDLEDVFLDVGEAGILELGFPIQWCIRRGAKDIADLEVNIRDLRVGCTWRQGAVVTANKRDRAGELEVAAAP